MFPIIKATTETKEAIGILTTGKAKYIQQRVNCLENIVKIVIVLYVVASAKLI